VEREPSVRAWTCVDADGAMQRARALDSQASAGLLHGLPIAVKDMFDTFDMPTCYGSPIYANHCPPRMPHPLRWRAPRRDRRRQDGHDGVRDVPAGGRRAIPANLEAHPGGSSSGSAAAVADGMVPLAFGTQTAGSIIRPAAFCGVVGYKPTYGTINRVGVKLLSDTLDTLGALARTVPDVALSSPR
jgi:Asp-tRNA(Asn)/Glu-tRNA(Gln) amidotransferase A subunit family amidase